MLKNIMEVPEVLAGAILNVNKLHHGTSICSAPIPLTTIPFSSGITKRFDTKPIPHKPKRALEFVAILETFFRFRVVLFCA
jgi:hypothetical protein